MTSDIKAEVVKGRWNVPDFMFVNWKLSQQSCGGALRKCVRQWRKEQTRMAKLY